MKRYAIYGAGSLGTVLGAYITKNGGKIDLINRNKAHVEALKEKGATINGTIEMTVPVTAIFSDEMKDKYDVILLLTKQLLNKEVVTYLKDYLADDGVIVTLQNGLPEPEIAPVQGKNITALFYYKGATKRAIATMLIPIAMKKHRNIEPSMLQDLKKNKPCEIDAINGVVCQWGRKCGVATPINDKIVEIIKKIEKGELKAEASNIKMFDELL